MYSLNHLLKTRDMVGQGPFAESAIILFIPILLKHWGQGQGTRVVLGQR